MKLRRFCAEDMGEGMKSVEEAMGPDAVILDTCRIDEQTEIVVAEDYEELLEGLSCDAPPEGQSGPQLPAGEAAARTFLWQMTCRSCSSR